MDGAPPPSTGGLGEPRPAHDDLARSTDDEVASGIARLHAIEQATRHQLLRFVAEYASREAYKSDGAADMESWLVCALSVTRARAAELVKVACRLESLPALAAAHSAGRLSWDQLSPIALAADDANDAYLADNAPAFSAEQCRDVARQLRRTSTATARQAHRRRGVRWWWDDQCLRLSGWLGDTDGATVAKALAHLAENAEPIAGSDGAITYEPFHERCADALTQLASSYLSLAEDADRATVVVHADAALVFGGPEPSGDGRVRIEDGPDIAVDSLRRLLCDTRWQLLAESPGGAAVGVGRTTRSVPPWLVRQLKRRDGGCRFPGCSRTRWLHAHHLVHWADGGRTDPENLVMLCGSHHRLLHEDGWKVSGSPGQGVMSFRAPNGWQASTVPMPLLRNFTRNDPKRRE